MFAETIVRTEHQEQGRLFKWAKDHEHEFGGALKVLYAIPNGGLRNEWGDGQRKKREGLRRGVPDICLPIARHGYNALYIEMKRTKGGGVSSHQSNWIQWLSEAGNKAVVCLGADAAIVEIAEYLKP